jgi:hypothetical protein
MIATRIDAKNFSAGCFIIFLLSLWVNVRDKKRKDRNRYSFESCTYPDEKMILLDRCHSFLTRDCPQPKQGFAHYQQNVCRFIINSALRTLFPAKFYFADRSAGSHGSRKIKMEMEFQETIGSQMEFGNQRTIRTKCKPSGDSALSHVTDIPVFPTIHLSFLCDREIPF